jgi:hypothetical protein
MSFTVEPHTARMTGMAWFIVTEDNNGCQVDGTPFYDDHEEATAEADRRNFEAGPPIEVIEDEHDEVEEGRRERRDFLRNRDY